MYTFLASTSSMQNEVNFYQNLAFSCSLPIHPPPKKPTLCGLFQLNSMGKELIRNEIYGPTTAQSAIPHPHDDDKFTTSFHRRSK